MDFYYTLMSPPCRTVLLTAAALGLDLNMKHVDLDKEENLKPEFLAINPEHCVPALVDGTLKIWESRAISAYLVNQYGKDDSLYPKDPKKRALVDRMLYFDALNLYDKFARYCYPVSFELGPPDSKAKTNLHEALRLLNGYLTGQDFATGSSATIADHALYASVATFVATGVDISAYPSTVQWLARCKKSLPGAAQNEQGAKEFADAALPQLAASKLYEAAGDGGSCPA